MIHRAPFGSLERFVAILLEHTGGNFPLWLMPNQVNILCVSEKYKNYAQKVSSYLENHEIRALLDDRNETIGKKIRESELTKTPYMIILGEKEAESQTISLRKHQKGDLGSFTLEIASEMIKKEIESSQSCFNV
jgi:threonyl-tRNA synthetase